MSTDDLGSVNIAHAIQDLHARQGVMEKPGDLIGPFRILSVLGEGGFGVVYLAERREPMVQRVALKVIKPGMDTRAVVARFEQERQALAMMDHPGVAKVFDAGATPNGRPYFAMEFVQGEPITAYCDRQTLSTRDRLELFLGVCEAVQHAHMRGIIHRDLKPSNVLVTSAGGKPFAKVIDFGIAKAISQTLTARTVFTEQGQLIGTPEYMSPEQAEARSGDVDTRTDVYSLGVLLYELLVGRLPFDPATLRSAGYAEIQRIIREVDPPRPSTKLSQIGAAAEELARVRQMGVEEMRRLLHRELEWIPLKAMRKDRTLRYRSPAEMGDDVRNYLEGRPLIAGPESVAYRFSKFVRRRRGMVIAVSVVLLALIVGVTGVGSGYLKAKEALASEKLALKQAGEALENEKAARNQANAALESEKIARANASAALENEKAALKQASSALENEKIARAEEARQRRVAEATRSFLQDMLSSVDPEKTKGKEPTVRDMLDSAALVVGKALKEEPASEAAVRSTIGHMYFQLSLFREAEQQLQTALELDLATLGAENKETLTVQHNLAAARLSMGKIAEARKMLEAVYALRAKTLGEGSEDALASLSLIGFTMQQSDEPEEALKVYRKVYEAQKGLLAAGARSRDAMETLASIADVLQDLGKLDDAEKAASELVENAMLAEGADGRMTLMGQSIRAAILKDLSRYDESERIARAVLESKRRIYGAAHIETLTTQNALAQTLEQLKRYDEAVELLTSAAAEASKSVGDEHDMTLTYRANLARAEHLRGNKHRAETLMRSVLAVRERVSGPESISTLSIMNNLGLLLLDMQKPVEAETIFRAMLKGVDKAMPEDHWILGQARVNVGECLFDQKKYEEAEGFLVAGYDKLVKVLPAGHSRIAGAKESLAKLYKAMGNAEKEAQFSK